MRLEFRKLTALFLALTISVPTVAAAAPTAVAEDVINGEYVVIINTDMDAEETESTGSIVFDSPMSVSEEEMPAMLSMMQPMGASLTAQAEETLDYTKYEIGVTTDVGFNGDYERTYLLVAEGELCYIWAEEYMWNNYYSLADQEKIIADMKETFDGSSGKTLQAMAGKQNFVSRDGSNKMSIRLDYLEDGTAGLYASESDVTCIYIDMNNYRPGSGFWSHDGLLVHEGHHALWDTFLRKNGSAVENTVSINEGLATLGQAYQNSGSGIDSSGRIGALKEYNLLRKGFPLLYETEDTAMLYGQSYLYFRYLISQMGDNFKENVISLFNTIYSLDLKDKTVAAFMDDLLAELDLEGNKTFAESVETFYIACATRAISGIYGFNGDTTVEAQLPDYPIYYGKSGESVELPGRAAIVVKTLNGSFTVPDDGGEHIKYIAVDRVPTQMHPAKGQGTAADPYVIQTLKEFQMIANAPNAQYKLGANIDASAGFTTIESFSGVLDGAGYKITNLSTAIVETNDGVIKNLDVTGTGEFYSANVGGVIAYINKGTIADSSVHGNFEASITNPWGGGASWGNIAGSMEQGTLARCWTDATVTVSLGEGTDMSVGALVGDSYYGTVSDCYSAGSMKAVGGNVEVSMGGLFGYILYGTTAKNSYSVTELTAETTGTYYTGRLCGSYSNRGLDAVAAYGLDGMKMSGMAYQYTDEDACTKTDAELKTKETFNGWDFVSTWSMGNGEYPTLRTEADIDTITATLGSYKDHYLGQTLNLGDATLTLNGTTTLPLTADMLDMSGWDSSKTGEVTLNGTYKGNEFSVIATIVDAPDGITGLEISWGYEGKTDYFVGEMYSAEGVKLMVYPYYYEITSGFTHNLQNALTAADTQVTYSYGGQTVSQDITVTAPKAAEIAMLVPPDTMEFDVGEAFDLDGALFQITYDNGTKGEIFSINAETIEEYEIGFTDYNGRISLTYGMPLSLTYDNCGIVIYVGELLDKVFADAGTLAVGYSISYDWGIVPEEAVPSWYLEYVYGAEAKGGFATLDEAHAAKVSEPASGSRMYERDEENDGFIRVWVFSGWDNGELVGNKLIFRGCWSPEPYRENYSSYVVKYEWAGVAPEDTALPVDSNIYETLDAARAVVDSTFAEGTTIQGKKDGVRGVWTFSGWEESNVDEEYKSITYTGSWSFTPNTAIVKYKVQYDWGTNAPTGEALPVDSNKYDSAEAAMDAMNTTYTSATEVSVEGGIWRFSGWTAETEGTTVTFTGSWTFTGNAPATKYAVQYDWGTNAPTGEALPVDSNKYDSAEAAMDAMNTTYTSATEVSVEGGIWCFSGWTAATEGKVVTFTGSWTFTANAPATKYTVKYIWGTDAPGMLPVDNREYDSAEEAIAALDNSYVPGMAISVEDGTWFFIDWTVEIDGMVVTFTGNWTFVGNEPATKYTVEYNWGTNAPADETLPVDSTEYDSVEAAKAAVDTSYNAGKVVSAADGTWVFSGWTATTEGTTVTFAGSWQYTAAASGDIYSIVYNWGVQAPADETLPVDNTEYGSAEEAKAAVDTTYTSGMVISVADGTWVFSGWDEGVVNETVILFTGSWTFTAKEPEVTVYQIHFDANGGSCDQQTATTKEDGTLGNLPIPTYSGYSFKGWYTELDGGEKITETTVFDSDKTIYAQWTKKSSGGSSGSGSSSSSGSDSSSNADNDAAVTKASEKETEIVETKTESVTEEVTLENVDETKALVLTINKKEASVLGKEIVNDVAPIIKNERTMIPARMIAEALGGAVAWNEAEKKVTIKKGEKQIEIVIGQNVAYVNGEEIQLDTPAFIENSRTYLPLRFIAENLDATVLWNEKEKQAIIVPKAEATAAADENKEEKATIEA